MHAAAAFGPYGLADTTDGPDDVHRSLWAAVILMALQDATRKAKTTDARRIKAEARGWFVDAGGDFHRVCQMAGFEPSWVRRHALAILD
jgi:hypothetical protein